MIASILPLPDEPQALKALTRTLLEQAPDEGLPLVLAGDWMADPLWERWGETLERGGIDRAQFGEIVAGYANELRLWVVGERPWEQAASGLIGRVARRLSPASGGAGNGSATRWQEALERIGVGPEAEMSALISRIGELQLLYDVAAPAEKANGSRGTSAAAAIVWAGARPRDPEVPFGEAQSGANGAAALAEALGRFLLKDPAYPPR
jgi:hypothetical protein